MCRFQAAALSCSTAARRAEYTARNASKLAAGIEDTNSQVIREATELVDEWVMVREGLETAEEVLTFVAQNREAFEEFQRHCQTRPVAPARRVATIASPGRGVGIAVVQAIRAARGR